ncbi:hypothetical protein V5F77_05280 [Xanthobacter sp. DSM 24535]|uniref:hypothetical protein n=1 Tax=Roseixanthobacter psychrophilus TaxID=3119917 RepID=UPI00372876F0
MSDKAHDMEQEASAILELHRQAKGNRALKGTAELLETRVVSGANRLGDAAAKIRSSVRGGS